MIDIGEKFPDVAFQNPASPGIVFGNYPAEMSEPINRSVRTSIDPTGIGIKNELPIEIWVKNPVNGMVDKPVADTGFVDISRFRIVDFESLVSAMSVGFLFQFIVK